MKRVTHTSLALLELFSLIHTFFHMYRNELNPSSTISEQHTKTARQLPLVLPRVLNWTLPRAPVNGFHELPDVFRPMRGRAEGEASHEVAPVGDADDESEHQPAADYKTSRCCVRAPLVEVLAEESLVDLLEAVAQVGIPVASDEVHLLEVRGQKWMENCLCCVLETGGHSSVMWHL